MPSPVVRTRRGSSVAPPPRKRTAARSPRPRGTRRGPSVEGRHEHLRLALADHEHVERLARRFKALGDPTRSKLVYALSHGELCVSDLALALGASLSATSHQLRILRDLEIVRVRRVGRSQLYVLNEDAFGFCSPRSCHAWKTALEPVVEQPV